MIDGMDIQAQTAPAAQDDKRWYIDDEGVRHPRSFYGDVLFLPARPDGRAAFESNLRQLSWDLRRLPLFAEYSSTFNTVPDLRDVMERALAIEPELRSFGVKELHVFGSVARGDADFESDIDFAALMDRGPGYAGDIFDADALLMRTMRRHIDLAELPFEGAFARLAGDDLVRVF